MGGGHRKGRREPLVQFLCLQEAFREGVPVWRNVRRWPGGSGGEARGAQLPGTGGPWVCGEKLLASLGSWHRA